MCCRSRSSVPVVASRCHPQASRFTSWCPSSTCSLASATLRSSWPCSCCAHAAPRKKRPPAAQASSPAARGSRHWLGRALRRAGSGLPPRPRPVGSSPSPRLRLAGAGGDVSRQSPRDATALRMSSAGASPCMSMSSAGASPCMSMSSGHRTLSLT